MNSLVNDRGQRAIAVGAPGSQARVSCEFPSLIEDLKALRARSGSTESAIRMIRKAGGRGMLDYESLLIVAGYEPMEAASQARSFGAMQR